MGLFRKKKPADAELIETKRSYGVSLFGGKMGVERTYRHNPATPASKAPADEPASQPTSVPSAEKPATTIVKQEFSPNLKVVIAPFTAAPGERLDRGSQTGGSPRQPAKRRRRGSRSAQRACPLKVYKVESADWRAIKLNVRPGDPLTGEMREVERQGFEWFLANKRNRVILENGESDPVEVCPHHERLVMYDVRCKIPMRGAGPWFLILDNRDLRADRHILIDLQAGQIEEE